jgi:hypothetical protein
MPDLSVLGSVRNQMRAAMRNLVLALLGSAVCLLAVTTTGVAAQKQGRSYDECRQLAISRGWKPRQNAGARFLRRKAAALKTQPEGFMARCVAGIQD